ncbi:hypothetical protein GLOIN_2v1886109 [Rhizophagus irregularis DAOM 181602=DAOM 197198]|nr:hypothetical protein GLOIN_2v1886109 [Rhizophagus irregularis DAOM 181602=DAOM 197198]
MIMKAFEEEETRIKKERQNKTSSIVETEAKVNDDDSDSDDSEEEMLDDSDDDEYNGYDGYNEYGERDRGEGFGITYWIVVYFIRQAVQHAIS